MGIDLISSIQPKNGGAFPTHEAIYGKGGFQARSDATDRNNIPTLNRVEGMHVWVIGESQLYRLGSGLTNSDWIAITGTGGVLANASTGALADVVTTSPTTPVSELRFSGVAPSVSGLASGWSGRLLVLLAVGGPLVLTNQDAGSVAANRIITGTGASVTVAQDTGILLSYDATTLRWRLDGGGGSVFTPGAGSLSAKGGGAATASGVSSLAFGAGNIASGAAAIAIGGGVVGPATASGDQSMAFGEESQATSTYATAIGKQCTATAAGALAAGEVCNATAANAIAFGYACTASGVFSTCFGAGCNASAAGSSAFGQTSSAPRAGQYAWNGGNLNVQQNKILLGADLVAASGVVLLDAAGQEFSLHGNTAYSMRVRIVAAQTAGTVVAADIYELELRTIGGFATIHNSTALAPTGHIAAAGWSAAISVSGADLKVHITCGSGADSVNFRAYIDWVEVYNLTDAAAAFDPATLNLTGWWRQDGVSPWAGVASTGTSGANGATEGTHPPGVGATLNALATASFNGTNQQITPAGTLGTYIAAGAGAGWALVNLASIAGTGAAFGTDAVFSTTASGYYAVEFNTTGPEVQVSAWDGAGKTAIRAFPTATWALVTWRHDGTNLQVGVNEDPGSFGGTSTIACGNVASVANGVVIGEGLGGFFLNGRVADMGIAHALTAGNFASIKSYVNARYGLSL